MPAALPLGLSRLLLPVPWEAGAMLYLVSPSTPLLRDLIRAGHFGAITTPATRYRIDGLPAWAADNACFGKGYPGDEKFRAWLEGMSPHAGRCLFAVAPDVVADAAGTIARSRPWLPVIRAMGYPAAFVFQNGQEHLPVPWGEFDVGFIGGDTAWKLGIAAAQLTREALARGKRMHAGRVNGGPRFAYMRGLGVHTADGKCVNMAPDKNVGRHDRWQARPDQGVLL